VSEPWDEYPDVPDVWNEDECLPLDQLHPLIHGASRGLLDAGDEDGALRAGWNALRDLLRARLNSNQDGMRLIDEIGPAQSARLNLTPNKTLSQQNQHEGVRHLLRGLVSYARNPLAHDSAEVFDGNRDEALHVLVVMSLVADHVEAAGTSADVEEAVTLLCEPDVPLDDQAIAAAIARAGRSQLGPLVEAIVDRIGQEQGNSHTASGLFAGFSLALRRPAKIEVFEIAAKAVSGLLMKATTTATGLQLLQAGVTDKLDPFAYAKVLSNVGTLDKSKPRCVPASRAGEIAAGLKETDRARVVHDQLMVIDNGDAVAAAESIEFIVAALREDQPRSPTKLQERFISVVADRFAIRGEVEIDSVLRHAFPFSSLSFSLYLLDGLRDAASTGKASAPCSKFVEEFGKLDRWPARSRRFASSKWVSPLEPRAGEQTGHLGIPAQ
jgi:uncharacterized protein (TIGR02391 family)